MIHTTTILDRQTFGHWAYLAIEKHFQKTIQYEADILADTDPEALHQMRVGMRSLRTAATGFAPALRLPKVAREKKIAKVARQLAELRDLDVLQEALETRYRPTLSPSEQKPFDKVLATLKKRRQKSYERVCKALKGERYQQLKQGVRDWLATPNYGELAEFAIAPILPDLLLPFLSRFFLHPAWLVGVKLEAGAVELDGALDAETVIALFDTQGDSLHDLRKQTKRVRYQMELFTDFYPSPYQDCVKDIKAIQGILGQIQDSFVLAAFLKETLHAEIAASLPTLAERLAEDRYRAWQTWQPLQQQYLNPQLRTEIRRVVLHPNGTAESNAMEEASLPSTGNE
jgi:CHAD domain-containing protein